VLYSALESLRIFAVLFAPILPDATPGIWAQLGLEGVPASVDPRTLAWGQLAAGTRIGQVKPVFPRIERESVLLKIEEEVKRQMEQEKAKEAAEETAAPRASTLEHATQAQPVVEEPTYINIDDFAKVEMRVGTVLEASRIEGADKLLKLKIDLGEAEPRQILAGIAQYYEPESLVGRKVAVVANLKPRKMRGLESQGMVVAASAGDEGRPVLATFAEDVPNGARLR